jgi:asparagine synthase (glutamine-hydrolysing)
MAILISRSNFDNSEKINKYFIHNRFKLYSNRYYYDLIGEVYDISINQLIELIITKNIEELRSICGDFVLTIYDKKEDKIFFINDRAGRNIVYYSQKNHLTISDDFWSIIRHDNYTLKDIDTIELKTQLFFSASSAYSTIIKGVNIFENAIFMNFNGIKLEQKKYWYFKLIKNNLTLNEKYDQLDNALNESFKTINIFNKKDTIYGIGVSGGMDSRIIPHYAFKNNMKLKSFIIGEEKPNLFLKSNDHTSSDLVVKYFNLEHKKLEFNELSYQEKNKIDCTFNPIGSSQIFKIPNIDKCDFNVLLTGASGFIVGSSPFYSKNKTLDLLDTLFIQQSDLKLKVKFYRIKKALNYLFGNLFNIKDVLEDSIDNIISKNEIKEIRKNLQIYIDNLDSLTHTEKLMNYSIGILGQKNKSGAFESLVNYKKNYTPYTPFLLNIVQTWTEEDIYDRKIFEDFINIRLPELANIKQQNHKPSVSVNRPNICQKILSLTTYVIRGQGVMNYNNWAKQKEFKSFIKKELSDGDYISRYIDIYKIQKLVNNNQLNADVLANCIKMNTILKMIDSKKVV